MDAAGCLFFRRALLVVAAVEAVELEEACPLAEPPLPPLPAELNMASELVATAIAELRRLVAGPTARENTPPTEEV